MTIIIQIIFWAAIPAVCIYYRVKKKINTSFAFFGIFTSFILGLILIGTFMEDPSEKFIEYMNRNKIEEARRELRIILQKNPADIKKIDKREIINLDAFRRMKAGLEREYLEIIEKSLERYKIDGNAECAGLDDVKKDLAGLLNAQRLLEMAESIGKERPRIDKSLSGRIARGKGIISALEEKCE